MAHVWSLLVDQHRLQKGFWVLPEAAAVWCWPGPRGCSQPGLCHDGLRLFPRSQVGRGVTRLHHRFTCSCWDVQAWGYAV